MPMSAELNGLIGADILLNHKRAVHRITAVHNAQASVMNAVQINLIHQHGATSDDPANIAMLQAAAGSPRSGASAIPPAGRPA